MVIRSKALPLMLNSNIWVLAGAGGAGDDRDILLAVKLESGGERERRGQARGERNALVLDGTSLPGAACM